MPLRALPERTDSLRDATSGPQLVTMRKRFYTRSAFHATMSTSRALQQVLHSWQSAGLGHLPKVAPASVEPAPVAVASVPVAVPPPQDTVPDMARKQAAAARPELPVIAVAPEIKMSGSREERLAALQARVAKCTRCQELATTRTQTVFGVGNPRPA